MMAIRWRKVRDYKGGGDGGVGEDKVEVDG